MLRAWTTDGDGEAVVVKAFNDTVLKKSLMTLGDGLWLGDEVNLPAGKGGGLPELSPLLRSQDLYKAESSVSVTVLSCLQR